MTNPFSSRAGRSRQVDPVKTQTLMESVLAKIDDMFDDDDDEDEGGGAMEVDQCELAENKSAKEEVFPKRFGIASREK